MAGKNKDAIRNALAQVVSYNGGNQFGAVAAGVADAIKDIPVVDATSGNVTLTADQSGACVFAGGGARTLQNCINNSTQSYNFWFRRRFNKSCVYRN